MTLNSSRAQGSKLTLSFLTSHFETSPHLTVSLVSLPPFSFTAPFRMNLNLLYKRRNSGSKMSCASNLSARLWLEWRPVPVLETDTRATVRGGDQVLRTVGYRTGLLAARHRYFRQPAALRRPPSDFHSLFPTSRPLPPLPCSAQPVTPALGAWAQATTLSWASSPAAHSACYHIPILQPHCRCSL